MYADPEIRHLMDLLPASGRMLTKLVSKPGQATVIEAPLPKPWMAVRPVSINFDLWNQLSRSQRDLLVLRTVSWVTSVRWFRPSLNQGLVLAGILGVLVEAVQGDAVGVIAAGSLSTIAGTQIWRSNHSTQRELEADETAIQVAMRRGYAESEAARSLLSAIETVAEIEGRPSLSFIELLRCQNLRSIAGVSPVSVPGSLRQN